MKDGLWGALLAGTELRMPTASSVSFAKRFTLSMGIAYVASAAWYIYQIVKALDIRTATGTVILFSQDRLAGDLFAVAGTAHWFVFGINRRTSRATAVGSFLLAGLHLLLFAVRAYLVPILWVMEQTTR